MSSKYWQTKDHIINAAHTRGYARGLRNEETSHLRLAVKQYFPISNPSPRSGDLTLIFSHGVGSSKESYEPFFDDLMNHYPRIRSVLTFDCAHHGQSYMLNRTAIGDEHDWYDTGRDLVHVINTLQADLPPPLIGIGQSFGGVTLIAASRLHPRLISGLCMVEPPLATAFSPAHHRQHRAVWMAKRRDWWPSREDAREDLLRLAYYRKFDPRVFERVMQTDLRDATPEDEPFENKKNAEQHASSGKLGVTLTTPKAMEVYTMFRTDLEMPGRVSVPVLEAGPSETLIPGFYRPEKKAIEEDLPGVFPPVLYVWGEHSDFPKKIPQLPKYLLHTTGSARHGSGGHATGRVSEVIVKEASHAVALEKPALLAAALVPWLRARTEEWEAVMSRQDEKEADLHPARVNPAWMRKINKL